MKRILRYILVIALSGITIFGYDRSVINSPKVDKDMLIVPNVIGLGVEGSKEKLRESGFVNICFANDASSLDQNELVVERQSIAPGDFAKKNVNVVLTCRKAEVLKCVNVWSLSVWDARRKLTEAGITHIRTDINKTTLGDEYDEWLVAEQSILPNQELYEYEEIMLSCEKGGKAKLKLISDDHLFFNTYSVRIYIDGEYFESLSDGATIDTDVLLLNGSHTISAYSQNDYSVYDTWSVNKTDNSVFRARIRHESNYVSIDPY